MKEHSWSQQSCCAHHVAITVSAMCHRHMKVALHALDHLNAIAWQQTALEPSHQQSNQGRNRIGAESVIPKPAGMASLERCLTLPEQLDGVTQPLLSPSLTQVTSSAL